jgi:putative ABC transport system substrate-binding protein
MLNRRALLASAGCLLLAPAILGLAQSSKVARVGILLARSRPTPATPDPLFDAFVHGLRDLGYVEGKNLALEWRFAEGKYERLPALAAELAGLKPDAILTHVGAGVRALQRATKSVPIVMTSFNRAVEDGYVASLARPGGNITGLALMSVDVSSKMLEMLQTMLPRLSRIAVPVNPNVSSHSAFLKGIQAAAQGTGLQAVAIQAISLADVEQGYSRMVREMVQAAIIPNDSIYVMHRHQVAALALKHRMPTIHAQREIVEAGGLISYGASVTASYRRAAVYVDKILKGAKPGDLPIEQPTTFELVINRKTAKALSITIPRELLARADLIID